MMDCTKYWRFAQYPYIFCLFGGISMRIVLDTDKKTITVPWNYQQKLEEYNAMVMEISGDASKKKTFKSFIDDIWKECMEDSDKHLITGKKPSTSPAKSKQAPSFKG